MRAHRFGAHVSIVALALAHLVAAIVVSRVVVFESAPKPPPGDANFLIAVAEGAPPLWWWAVVLVPAIALLGWWLVADHKRVSGPMEVGLPNVRHAPFGQLADDHPTSAYVLSLMAHDNEGRAHSSGTAFFVAPGLAVAARHVLAEYWKLFDNVEMNAETSRALALPTGFSVLATQTINGRQVLWDVGRMWAADPIDIAILELQPHPGHSTPSDWLLPTLRFAPPKVGDPLWAIGFNRQEVSFQGDHGLTWTRTAAVAVGQVDEVHPLRRDRGLLNWPCARTNARIDGGMSGGPVVDERGHIFGIVCSTLAAAQPDEEHASYASLLWPLLGLRIRTDLLPLGEQAMAADADGAVAFLDLYRHGILQSPDWQRVTIGEDGCTVTVAFETPRAAS